MNTRLMRQRPAPTGYYDEAGVYRASPFRSRKILRREVHSPERDDLLMRDYRRDYEQSPFITVGAALVLGAMFLFGVLSAMSLAFP